MTLRQFTATIGLGMFIVSIAPAARADIFATINGAKQGHIGGDTLDSKRPGQIVVTSFDHDVKVPRDPSSGLATGKRQHSPITFRINEGKASVQLMQALITNETLTSVIFEFAAPDPTGLSKTFQRVTLQNAVVSDIHQRASAARTTWTDDVSIIFQKIEVQDLTSGVVSTDSNTATGA